MTHAATRLGLVVPAVFACLAFSATLAADIGNASMLFAGESLGLIASHEAPEPEANPAFPMVLDHGAGLDFDLGGSDTAKLQLVLEQPLSLSAGMNLNAHSTHSGDVLGLDATLNVPLTDNFGLGAHMSRQAGQAGFRPLGSIECLNGTLRANSYTASGCHFVDDSIGHSEQRRIDLGARFGLGNATAAFSWFTQDSGAAQHGVRRAGSLAGLPLAGGSLLSPNLGNPLLSASAGEPLQYLNSEASGVDLNFKVGVTTDTQGDLMLGLAFSRVFEADYQGLYAPGAEAFSWTLAEPFNTARMNFEWTRGAFSTGVQGYYRDSVNFLNRNNVDSLTTFDVHFTWRTPWNANLSVGASNVLNAGADGTPVSESQPADPLESIYGRIPYVRYKQDL